MSDQKTLVSPEITAYNNKSGIHIPQGQDNLQYDANALGRGYQRPSPVQALYYKQVKFYGLCAIDDDDIDEFNEYVSTAKNERIPLTLTKITSAIKNEMYVIKKNKHTLGTNIHGREEEHIRKAEEGLAL